MCVMAQNIFFRKIQEYPVNLLYFSIIFLLINPALVKNVTIIFGIALSLLPLRVLWLALQNQEIKIEKNILWIPCILFFLYSIGLFNDVSPDPIFRLVFVLLPVIVATALYHFYRLDYRFMIFARCMVVSITILSISQIIQFVFFPNLFGLVQHPIYNGDLIGTASFRAIGFGGSPQNNALILSLGLFLAPTITNTAMRIIYLTLILIGGFSTLATFFGVSLAIFIFSRYKWTLVLLPIVFTVFAFIAVENTAFESLNFSEVTGILDRIIISDDRGVIIRNFAFALIFGADVGIATSGLIDMGYFSLANYNHESWLVGRITETGIVGAVFFTFIFWKLLRFVIVEFFTYNDHDNVLWGISLILILAAIVTPNFDSPRMAVIFWMIFYFVLSRKNISKDYFGDSEVRKNPNAK